MLQVLRASYVLYRLDGDRLVMLRVLHGPARRTRSLPGFTALDKQEEINKKAGVAAGFVVSTCSDRDQCAASSVAASCRAISPLTASCTFSKARTSIWRTRSRLTSYSAATVFERHRLFRQAAGLEDAPFAIVEHGHGAGQRAAAVVVLLVLGQRGFLVRRVVDQPVLPFGGSPSARIGALSEASPPRRRFIDTTSAR